MIILSSNGLTSEKLAHQFKDYIKSKNKTNLNVALITTAGIDENNDCIPNVRKVYDELNAVVSFVDINKCEPNALMDYDIIEFLGGNPFFLLKSINTNNYRDALELFVGQGGILLGWSAGAFVLQKSIDLANKQTPFMNEKVGLTDMTGLGFVNFEIMPHYQWLVTQIKDLDSQLAKHEIETGRKLYKLKDGQAVFAYDNGDIVVID